MNAIWRLFLLKSFFPLEIGNSNNNKTHRQNYTDFAKSYFYKTGQIWDPSVLLVSPYFVLLVFLNDDIKTLKEYCSWMGIKTTPTVKSKQNGVSASAGLAWSHPYPCGFTRVLWIEPFQDLCSPIHFLLTFLSVLSVSLSNFMPRIIC